jgi:hypothetical protein
MARPFLDQAEDHEAKIAVREEAAQVTLAPAMPPAVAVPVVSAGMWLVVGPSVTGEAAVRMAGKQSVQEFGLLVSSYRIIRYDGK